MTTEKEIREASIHQGIDPDAAVAKMLSIEGFEFDPPTVDATLEDELRAHEWEVMVDEDSGAIRIISMRLRDQMVIVPRGAGNAITIAHMDPAALHPDGKRLHG